MNDVSKEQIKEAVVEFFVDVFNITVKDDNSGEKIDNELLVAKNEGLRKQNSLIDAEMQEKLEELETINTSIRTQKNVASELRAANESFEKSTRNEILKEFNKSVALTTAELSKREKDVKEREQQADLKEKSIEAKTRILADTRAELDTISKQQQEQMDEIEKATKALSIKSIDYKHNVETNNVRSDELDKRETTILAKETELSQRESDVELKEQKSRDLHKKLTAWHAKLETTEKSQEKVQESFKSREKKLDDRERAINDRIAVKKLR